MPMLAERRRKTKWTNPGRQALWNRDSGDKKFGREMMEKMGWKVGQGLGAYEQGIKEPLKISFKNDNKGMGFKESDNEWTQQQCEFDEFLNKLSSEKKELPRESQRNTVQSLEEKSRLSKARVHYHKFTRGKDLAKYSKKDLECILGRNGKQPCNMQSNVESLDDNIGTRDNGLITAGSMVDYFAQKMQSKIMKKNYSLNVMNPEVGENLLGSNLKDELEENVVNSTVELIEKMKKKSKRKKEKDKDGCNEEPCNEIYFNNPESYYKMKSISEGCKKRKKTKITEADDQSDPLDGSRNCENVIIENELVQMPEEKGDVYETSLEDGIPGEKLKRKKKKRKKENSIAEFDTKNVEVLNVIGNEEYMETEEKINPLISVEEAMKKKRKTSKRKCEVIIDEDDAGGLKEKIKKKKKCLEVENIFSEKDCKTDKSYLNPVSNAETNSKKNEKEKTKTKYKSAAENKDTEKDQRKETVDDDSLLYKRELLNRKFSLKSTSQDKLLNLIYCLNTEQFPGSNLSGLAGYGTVRELLAACTGSSKGRAPMLSLLPSVPSQGSMISHSSLSVEQPVNVHVKP